MFFATKIVLFKHKRTYYIESLLKINKIENNRIKIVPLQTKKPVHSTGFLLWALTDSNRRPSACKADALNQLS